MPLTLYDSCVGRCEPSRAEYELLRNGLVVRDAAGNEEVQIMCDDAAAESIMEFAASECPEALPYIKKIMQ